MIRETLLPEGEIVAGRFAIERAVAEGGMGRIYRAIDALTGAAVAFKVMTGETGDGAESADGERFAREAAVLSELGHPAIVRYVAHGRTAEGQRYLAMEWLEGEDLQAFLARRKRSAATTLVAGVATAPASGDRASLADALIVGRRVAGGLVALHDRGLVHRDIKPANVFLPEGRPDRAKILDFGLARRERITALTGTGVLVGTPTYASPEQARGRAGLDGRSDVWSLGCLLFEMLTGEPPFRGVELVAVLAKIILEEPPDLRTLRPDLPRPLAALLTTMLAKDPAFRPTSREVAERLEAFDELLDATDLDETIPASSSVGPFPLSARSAALGAAERRVCSVLLATGASADAWADATNKLEEVLRPFGAHLEPLADGSKVVTMSGAFVATDQAVRAARAALAIRSVVSGVRIVVASGRAEGSGARVVGELIDRASHDLRSTVSAGIRLDTVTADLVDGRFSVGTVSDEPGVSLDGEIPEGTRTLLGKATTWVGRERELAALEAYFDECVEEPVARAVIVKAPAGVGKSRLRHELLRRLGSRAEPFSLFQGQGDSVSAGSPFVMIAPALRRSAGILEGEPEGDRRAKLASYVARHVEASDRARVTAYLGELVGVPFPSESEPTLAAARRDPMVMGDAMRAAFVAFLEAECREQAVVFIVEDLHWGDLPSVQFLDAALRVLRDAPFFVLALARPELATLFPGLWAERAAQEIRLDGLSKKASERLVRQTLGASVAADLVADIVQRADGNAFFLEELIRAVATGNTELPDSVLGMLQARLDAFGQEAKRVLRAASVFGELFWVAGVAALFGEERIGAASVGEWIADLTEREIITKQPSARFPGQTELRFRHALVRDAAYAMLTDDDRVLGHRLAADWLESVGEGDALVLAKHHAEGGQPERARAFYARAADQAFEGNDLAAAVAHAESAVLCGATGSELGELRRVQAAASYWSSQYETAQAHADAAVESLPAGSASFFRCLADGLVSSARRGQPDEVSRWLERALATDARGDDERSQAARVVCLCRGAFQLVFAGRFDQADPILEQVRAELEASLQGDAVVSAQVNHVIGVRAAHAGDVGTFLVHLERAIHFFEVAGDLRNVALESPTLGWCHAEVGDAAGAEAILRAAVDRCERLGVTQPITYAQVNIGYALALAGKIDEAREVQRLAASRCKEQGNPRLGGWSRVHLSTLELASGHRDEAEAEARTAVELLAASPGLRAWAHAAHARALLGRGAVDEALAESQRGYAILRNLGAILQCETLVPVVHAECLLGAGQAEDARAIIERAHKRLLDRARRFDNVVHRDGFLSLPDSRATVDLAHKLGAAS